MMSSTIERCRCNYPDGKPCAQFIVRSPFPFYDLGPIPRRQAEVIAMAQNEHFKKKGGTSMPAKKKTTKKVVKKTKRALATKRPATKRLVKQSLHDTAAGEELGIPIT